MGKELLEINLISAQQLPKRNNSHSIQTYVVAGLSTDHQNLPLVSRTDTIGDQNPTWNDRFVLPIDADLKLDSCLILKVYRVHRIRKDDQIGQVNVRLEHLLETGDRMGPKCLAFYVRNRKDQEPEGILNLGVEKSDRNALLLSSESGLDYRKLMGGGDHQVKDCSNSFGRLVKRSFTILRGFCKGA